jgi:hypothetical protein
VANQTKPRQDEDVNLGVAKKPEQVHIEHRVPTQLELEVTRIKEGKFDADVTRVQKESRWEFENESHPRILRIVVRKLIEPARLLSPDRWRLKMATSTPAPLLLLSGG